MTINEIQEEIISDLEDLETIEKYEYLINLGKLLPQISQKDKIDKNKIVGCQSRAWIFEIPQNVKQSLQTQNIILIKEKFSNLQNTKNLENQSEFKEKEKIIINQNFKKNPKIVNSKFSQNNSKNLSQTLSQNLEQKLFFGGFSDSQIVCGLLGLLWKIFDGKTKNEILHSDLFLLTRIGFDELLTVRRREGFWQIYDRIIQMCKS